MDQQYEIDARARALLAESTPQRWDEARRRLALVRLYLGETDRSAVVAERYAGQAGIGRSLFYRLARIYSQTPKKSATDDPGDRREPTPGITARAIERAGPSASPAQLFRTAVELSIAEGLAPPSRKAFRTQTAAMLAGESIAARMRLNAEFAIDRAILDMDVDTGTGPCEPGQLVCVVDLVRGTIVRHALCVGRPPSDRIVPLVCPEEIGSSRIAVSESDDALFIQPVRSAIASASSRLVVGRWHLGTAVRAVVGLRIGKVALLSRLPGSTHGRTPVSFDTARQVVEQLMIPYVGGDRSP